MHRYKKNIVQKNDEFAHIKKGSITSEVAFLDF